MPPLPLGALTQIISSAFNRAALAIEAGGNRAEWETVLKALLAGLARRA